MFPLFLFIWFFCLFQWQMGEVKALSHLPSVSPMPALSLCFNFCELGQDSNQQGPHVTDWDHVRTPCLRSQMPLQPVWRLLPTFFGGVPGRTGTRTICVTIFLGNSLKVTANREWIITKILMSARKVHCCPFAWPFAHPFLSRTSASCFHERTSSKARFSIPWGQEVHLETHGCYLGCGIADPQFKDDKDVTMYRTVQPRVETLLPLCPHAP